MRALARVLALAGVTASAVALATAAGCTSLETEQAPDAGLPPCDPGPFIFCNPAPPEIAGCNTDEGQALLLRRVPRATRYPLNCVIHSVGPRDENNDCRLDAVCKCVNGAANTNPPDSGLPPPPPMPRWSCDPP